jgi:digeranylgeranylglycerophospholipid reductase
MRDGWPGPTVYDVIVVGASFSGLMTALSLKSKKVLLIEKRKQPGTPVNTTGAVPIEWLTKMGVFPSRDCIAGNLSGVELVAPNGESAVLKNAQPDGMVLYPDRYVKWLAERAVDAGNELITDTVFKGLTVEDGGDPKVTVETSRGTFRGRFLVGADGAASPVGRSAGLGERPAPEDMHIGMEYTVENKGVQDPEVFRLYLGHDVAPLGYAWSFPEGKDRLKVGLGIPQSASLTVKKMVEKFLDRHPEFRTPISKSNGGIIPTAPPLKTAVKENIVLVGDAAHFCSALHGGGIWFGMQSGQLAGQALARGEPEMYDRLWKSNLGGVLSRHYKLKRVIYSMSDRNFDDLIRVMKTFVRATSQGKGLALKVPAVFFSDPGFVFDMALKWSRHGLAPDAIKRLLIPSFRIA